MQETEDGTRYNVHSWLKVEYKSYDGKSRTLYIELYSGPEYATVKVVQDNK